MLIENRGCEIKRKMKEKIVHIIILSIFFMVIFSSFIGAGFSDWFKGTITGRVTSQQTNVSLVVTGTTAVTIQVLNATLAGTHTDPTENGYSSLRFNAIVSDTDGVNDINDTSIRENFSRSGEALRSNSSCNLVADLDSTSANFSCIITMAYFDGTGSWTISVGATDLGNTTFIYNTSMTFQYNQLQAVVISPTSITFPSVVPGTFNQTSNNDPTLVNNTGNYNVASGNLRANGVHLYGQTDSTKFIDVKNFSINNQTGGSPAAECHNTNAINMTNGTAISLTNTVLPPGNNSLNFGNETAAQEQLYYCLRVVPSALSSQTYATNGSGVWTISIV